MLPPDSLVFHIGIVARTLWFEFRSLSARIRLQLGSRRQFDEWNSLPYFQAGQAGYLTVNLRSHACIAGIEATLSRYPELSTFDELMYREGWNRAEQWLLYTASNEGREKVQASKNLLYEDEVREAYARMIAECWPPVS